MEGDFIEEQKYLSAKKRIKDIKAFYVHLIINIFSLATIIAVNLIFVPEFHFFWFAAAGIFLALFFHWLGVFGFKSFGLGKDWEDSKIKELMDKNEKR